MGWFSHRPQKRVGHGAGNGQAFTRRTALGAQAMAVARRDRIAGLCHQRIADGHIRPEGGHGRWLVAPVRAIQIFRELQRWLLPGMLLHVIAACYWSGRCVQSSGARPRSGWLGCSTGCRRSCSPERGKSPRPHPRLPAAARWDSSVPVRGIILEPLVGGRRSVDSDGERRGCSSVIRPTHRLQDDDRIHHRQHHGRTGNAAKVLVTTKVYSAVSSPRTWARLKAVLVAP